MLTQDKINELRENISNILFDFWKGYSNETDCDKRDIIIENAISHIETLLKEQREEMVKELDLIKRIHTLELDSISLKSLEEFIEWSEFRKNLIKE